MTAQASAERDRRGDGRCSGTAGTTGPASRGRRAVGSIPQHKGSRDGGATGGARVVKEASTRRQERREGRVLVVEDQRRLAVELVYLGVQIRVARGCHNECRDPRGAVERRPKVADAPGTPAFGPAIGDQHRVVRQHPDERVEITRVGGLGERPEQSPVHFRRGRERALLRRDVLSRSLEELTAGRCALPDQRRDLVARRLVTRPGRSRSLSHPRVTLNEVKGAMTGSATIVNLGHPAHIQRLG
jgi:hypothetical protein